MCLRPELRTFFNLILPTTSEVEVSAILTLLARSPGSERLSGEARPHSQEAVGTSEPVVSSPLGRAASEERGVSLLLGITLVPPGGDSGVSGIANAPSSLPPAVPGSGPV